MEITENTVMLLFALFLVFLNGFFVAAEFAIVKLRHTRVEELRRLHGIRGHILALVHQKLDAYLSACQLGITLASLGLGWIGEPAFARLLESPLQLLGLADNPAMVHSIAFVLAFGTISYLHIVVGELAPKSAALRMPEVMSLWTAVPLYLFYWSMFPFIWGLNASANWILRRTGLGNYSGNGHEAPYSHEELRTILHLSRAAADKEEADLNRMLTHTLDLPKLCASDVMRNWRELISITSLDTHADVQRILQSHRYSRYPYIDAHNDEILGVLHLKDIYPVLQGENYAARLRSRMLPIIRVRESTPVIQLLRRFKLGAPHLALVEDPDGHAVGFVTLEDVLEAVFGEITDEHEAGRASQISRKPQRLDDGTLLARGDTPLFQLERELGEPIPESNTLSTVTGLLMERLGQIPTQGAAISIGSYTLRVIKVLGTNIETVHIVRTPETAAIARQ